MQYQAYYKVDIDIIISKETFIKLGFNPANRGWRNGQIDETSIHILPTTIDKGIIGINIHVDKTKDGEHVLKTGNAHKKINKVLKELETILIERSKWNKFIWYVTRYFTNTLSVERRLKVIRNIRKYGTLRRNPTI